MQALADSRSSGGGTAYIHWKPQHSPYAIELRTRLIDRLILEITKAKQLGVEIGGLLIGSFPKATVPTLRIEDFVPLPRNPEDGPSFVLNPDQEAQFASARREAITTERSAVGFFRSHLREEPMVLTEEDRQLSAKQFRKAVHVILLVGTAVPRFGSLFLAAGGELLDEPVAEEFPFDPRELEIQTRVHPSVALAPELGHKAGNRPLVPEDFPADPSSTYYTPPKRSLWWAVGWVSLLMLICLIGGMLLRPLLPGVLLEPFAPASSHYLNLTITNTDQILKITWNHEMPEIFHARYGIVRISDSGVPKEIQLTPDELRVGVIEYQRMTDRVTVTLVLEMPGFTSLSQTVSWQPL